MIAFLLILFFIVLLTPIFAFAIVLLAQLKKIKYIEDSCILQEFQEKNFVSQDFLLKKYETVEVKKHRKKAFLHFYRGTGDKKLVLLVPGFSCSWKKLLPLAQAFFSCGWNVAVLNHTIDSKHINPVSLGVLETKLANDAIKLLREIFLEVNFWGILGVSLGGVVSILTSESVDFKITDCAFSSTRQLAISVLKKMQLPRFVGELVFFVASVLHFIKTRVWFYKVNCKKNIKSDDTPILIIHGEEDSLIPVGMATELFTEREKAFPNSARIAFIPKNGGRSHAENFINAPRVYSDAIFNFIESVEKNKKNSSF